jgi:hypothetical protein
MVLLLLQKTPEVIEHINRSSQENGSILNDPLLRWLLLAGVLLYIVWPKGKGGDRQ